MARIGQKEKRPFYKNGFVWAVFLIVVGVATPNTDKDANSGFIAAGIAVLMVTVIRRIIGALKKRKALRHNTSQSGVQTQVSAEAHTAPVQNPSAPLDAVNRPERQTYKIEAHRVAGVRYYEDAIDDLGILNDDYSRSAAELREMYEPGDRIWEYTFDAKPTLTYEPDNPYGANAIRVDANGIPIGHIKSGSATHVRKLMESDKIASMTLDIYGGRFKELEEDGDDIIIVKEGHNYAARLTLYVKPD